MSGERNDEAGMRLALEIGREGVRAGQSPFGAAIVRSGNVLAVAHNSVLRDVDPTAHAEIRAIRAAARAEQTIDLTGATIYSTTEPCPMCFAAIHWARIGRIIYGASIADAASAGFNEIALSNQKLARDARLTMEIVPGVLVAEAVELFRLWQNEGSGRTY